MFSRRRNNRSNKGTKVRRPNLTRRANGRVQNLAGVSHRDGVPQVRKFTSYNTCTLVNQQGDQAFGFSAISVTPSVNTSLGRSLGSFVGQYEEYRIRRIRARATCGKGFTNDRRIRSQLLARVDTNYLDSSDTWANVQSMLQSENCVIKTFTERGNVLLADFKPIQFNNQYPTTVPTLPSRNQWFRLQDYASHTWRGGLVALILSETGIGPNEISMNITLECDVEFRGRVQDASQYAGSRLFLEPSPIDEVIMPPPFPSMSTAVHIPNDPGVPQLHRT
jgi:hypothetical protein